MHKQYRHALIVEGGAMRSVFSAGLLDGFLQRQFNPFDFCIGVSAGASNLAMFLSGHEKKGLQFFLDVSQHKAFISLARFLRGGHLMDLQWLFHLISNADLDLSPLSRQTEPLLICATDVETGKAEYIEASPENILDALQASMALPLIYRQFPAFQGRPMADGGMADGIPLGEAMRRGANKIMVVRSRPQSYVKRDTPGHRYIRWKVRHYPALSRAMQGRVQRHRAIADCIQNPPPGIEIVDICPPEQFRMGRFSRNREQLLQGYHVGLSMADDAINKWMTFSSD